MANQSVGSSSRSISSSTSDSYSATLSPPSSSQYVPRFDHSSMPRRQTLTAGETRKIDDMFLSIFYAASRQEDLTQSHNGAHAPAWATEPMRISTKPKVPVRWPRPGDDVLDLMKEEIEHCDSDQVLYAWTLERLFGKLEGTVSEADSQSALESTEPEEASLTSLDAVQEASQALPSFAYPQLLAIVMRTFRTKYRNPHTALALFDYARHVSALSYVSCCGTAAYNELIETRWDSFRDLQGVCDAVEEMKLNKVRFDTRTTKLVESLRREVGQRNFWQEEGFGESHTGVMDLLQRIESTCWPGVDPAQLSSQNYHHSSKQNSKWRPDSEVWKRPSLSDNEKDRLEFV